MVAVTELEFKVDGHTYRAGRISTFDQMHVAAQWRETLMALAFAKKNRTEKVTDEIYRETVTVIMAGGLGHITAQSREEITRLALSVVTRQQKGTGVGWAQITTSDGTIVFDDIRLPQLISILYNVFDHNGLVDFFSVGLSSLGGPKEEEKSGPPSPRVKIG